MRDLRRIATAVGANAVGADDAGREHVAAMMTELRRSEDEAAKREAEAAFLRYEATFRYGAVAAAGVAPTNAATPAVRLRGRSFLLCYNWDVRHARSGSPYCNG